MLDLCDKGFYFGIEFLNVPAYELVIQFFIVMRENISQSGNPGKLMRKGVPFIYPL
jgi:hypothetical protein